MFRGYTRTLPVLLCVIGVAGCGSSSKSSKSSGFSSAASTSGTTAGAATGTGATAGGATAGGATASGATAGGTGTTASGATASGATAGGTSTGGTTDDHGNDGSGASFLRQVNPLDGQIDYAGDPDWFRVTLSGGVAYEFFTLDLAGGMDTVLRLVDVNGTSVLAENDSRGPGYLSSLIAYTVPQDGDYYLVVVHKDPAASSGTYKINYLIAAASSSGADDHENDAQHATPIAVGTPTHGICEIWGDQDWFRVTLVSGRTYDVAALGVTTSDDPAIWLYDSAQTLLAVDDDSGSAYPGGSSLSALVAGFVAPADGDYFIRVSGPYPTAQPEYHVVVEPR